MEPDLLVVVLDHNRAPGRAPTGKGLLSSYWHTAWADEHWDHDDDEIVDAACCSCLEQLFPRLASTVEFTHVQPLASGGRDEQARHLPRIWSASPPPPATTARVQLCGDYLSASTINASLCSGERAAERLLAPAPGRVRPVERW